MITSRISNDLTDGEQFWQWCDDQGSIDHEVRQAAYRRGLDLLHKAVRSGEIDLIDGVESQLSNRLRAFHNSDLFEMNRNWICTSQTWVCPCCSRNKFGISRLGKKGQILAKLVIHHDHMGEATKAAFHAAFEKAGTNSSQQDGHRLVERVAGSFAAYDEVLICEDCNNADTEAKKLVNAPKYFSFSVSQIRQFISSADHKPHVVDNTNANAGWEKSIAAYQLRMRLIQSVAIAAATDSHWFESKETMGVIQPPLNSHDHLNEQRIKRLITIDDLLRVFGPKKQVTVPDRTGWRTKLHKVGKTPPANFSAMLTSGDSGKLMWNAVADEWACPICRRLKNECVYVAENGKVQFSPLSPRKSGAWRDIGTICNPCGSVVMSL